MIRSEEQYVGRGAMEMTGHGRRKRGIPKRRWLDKVKDDIKEKRLVYCTTVLHMEAYVIIHRPHIKVGKDEVEEV